MVRTRLFIEIYTLVLICWCFLDAVLAIAGSGKYIEQKVMVNSRIYQGMLNLNQMKALLKYIIGMVGSIEGETSTEKYVEVFALSKI